MALSRQEIKNRIRSVDSTKKITKVMQLIASTELTKQRKAMEANQDYASGLEKALQFALRSAQNSYVTQEQEGPAYVFAIVSDMGLCGSYNANIYRQIQNQLNDDDKLVMIGARGQTWADAHGQEIVECVDDLNLDIAYSECSRVMEQALQAYRNKEVGSVKILYTHYKNTLTYQPILETILPMEVKPMEESSQNALTEFEPSESELLETMIPMVLKSMLYSRYLESKTSEQASRRMAMEAATDNANELHDELMLAYNQARQSAITNEIIDIVGGANALT